MNNQVTAEDVQRAFTRFRNGERPAKYAAPKTWFVIDPLDGSPYPAKGIWGLASGVRARHTHVALQGLRELGFVLASEPNVVDEGFDRRVHLALQDDEEDRLRRLAQAPRLPKRSTRTVVVYDRNPDVVAQALVRAAGVCERCRADAPFLRAGSSRPYLEVHHIVSLADGGEDHLDNVTAICPNCHREVHYG